MKQREIKGRCKTTNMMQSARHDLRSFTGMFIHALNFFPVAFFPEYVFMLVRNEGMRIMA